MQFLIPYTRVDKPSNLAACLSARDSPQSLLYVVSETESDVDHNSEYQILDDDKEEEEDEAVLDIVPLEEERLEDNNTRRTRSTRSIIDQATHNITEQRNIIKSESQPEPTEKPDLILEEPQDFRISSEITAPIQSTPPTAPNYDETPEWDFFRSLMPDIITMTAAQKRKMRMKFIGVIDDILVGE